MSNKQDQDMLDEFLEDLQLNSDDELETEKEEFMKEIYQKLGLNRKKASSENWSEKAEAFTIILNLFGELSVKDKAAIEKDLAEGYGHYWRKSTVKRENYLFVSEFNEEERISKITESGLLFRLYRWLLKLRLAIIIFATYIAQSQLFVNVTLLVIIINSIKLAIDDPSVTTESDLSFELFFNVFYVFEMCVKIFSMGFVLNKKSYLRDAWNILDFIIVITSLLPYVITLSVSLKPLRVFRVLRPLRTITKIKELKEIVGTLFEAKGLIIDAIYILFFFCTIFAIIGLQFFRGVLKNQCIDPATGQLNGALCSSDGDCAGRGVCGRTFGSVDDTVNFDTYPWAMLMVYQGLTQEAWSQIMAQLMSAVSYFTIFYYIPIIIIGTNMLTNLAIAIINYKFSEIHHRQTPKAEEPQTDRWEIARMKELVCNNVNLYYDQVSNLKYKGLITEKRASGWLVGTAWEKRNPAAMNPALRKPAARTVELEKKESMEMAPDQEVQQRSTQKRITRMRQFSSVKLNYHGEDSEQLLKKLHFEPIILRPFNRAIPEQEEAASEDSINTEDLLENIRKESPEARQLRFRKRKMMEMKRFIADLKLKTGEDQNRDLAEQASRFDFTKIDPEALQRNYDQLFSDMALDTYLHDIRKKDDLVEVNFKSAPTEEDSAENGHEVPAAKILSVQFDRSMDLLKEVNLLIDKDLKIRVKSEDELATIHRFEYSSLILNEEAKREAELIKKLIGKRSDDLSYRLSYKVAENPGAKEPIGNYELKLPELVIEDNKLDDGVGLEQLDDTLIRNERDNMSDQAIDNENMFRKMRINDGPTSALKKKGRQFKDTEIKHIFFQENKLARLLVKDSKKVSITDAYQAILSVQQGDGQAPVELNITSEVISKQPRHLPDSLNISDGRYITYLTGLEGVLMLVRTRIKEIAFSSLFDNLILIFVIANTVTLSLTGFVSESNTALAYLSLFFTFSFAFDVVIKIIAVGLNYFREPMNDFDAIVSVLSLYELGINELTGSSLFTAFRSIRIFRAFRVLRIARFIRSLRYMQIIFGVINATLSEFIWIFLLMLLFLYIYTLLGRQLFSGLSNPTDHPRMNFNSFLESFFTSFVLLTTNNWSGVFYNIYKMDFFLSGYVGAIFCVFWIFLGNYCLLNLFLAILLEGFKGDSSSEVKADIDQLEAEYNPSSYSTMDLQTSRSALKTERMSNHSLSSRKSLIPIKPSSNSSQLQLSELNCEQSLFIFGKDNLVRQACFKIIRWKYAEVMWQVAIGLSSVYLIIETYLREGISEEIDRGKLYANYAISALFIFESTVKIVALGFVMDSGSYLRDNWSKLDFVIVVFSIVDMSISINLSFVKIMRSLRPLRFISSSVSMRVIVSALMESIGGIVNIGFVVFLVLLMFAILLINLMRNNLFYCYAKTYGLSSVFSYNQQDCTASLLPAAEWSLYFINFQNIGNGLLSLFVVITKEDFPYYFYQWADSGSIQPTMNSNLVLYTFVMFAFVFICSIFLVNLITGVIFLNYHIAEKRLKPRELTEAQESWIAIEKLIVESRPALVKHVLPPNPFQRFFFKIVHNYYVEQLINIIIVLNVILLALVYDDQSVSYTFGLQVCSFCLSFVFVLEIILKFFAFGPCNFWLILWNWFDLAIVVMFMVDFADDLTPESSFSNSFFRVAPQIFRMIRVLKLYRLFGTYSSLKGVKKLIETIYYSVPAMLNALALLLLTQFLFAILGAFLFAKAPINVSTYPGLTNYLNFRNFHSAFLSMFVWTTGEGWYLSMFELIEYQSYIVCIYWLMFIILVPIILVQLFVLVMLDELESNFVYENNPNTLFNNIEEDFLEQWVQLSDKGEGLRIEERKVIDIYLLLKLPLGFNMQDKFDEIEQELLKSGADEKRIKMQIYESKLKMKKEASREILEMQLTSSEGYLFYHEIFYEIAKRRFYPSLENASDEQLAKLDSAMKKAEKRLHVYKQELRGEESEAKQKEVNPVVRMLFSQMVINTWNRYSQRKGKLKDDQSVDEIEPLYLKTTNHRAREQRNRSKNITGLRPIRSFQPIPNTELYETLDQEKLQA